MTSGLARNTTNWDWLFRWLACVPLVLLTACSSAKSNSDEALSQIKLPPGFEIRIYARGVVGARSMALGPGGTLFVGTRGEGKVYALRDTNGDHQADQVLTIASGLNRPNGVAFRDGALYVAEIFRVLRFNNIEARLANPPQPVVVNDTLPREGHHGWKFIRFGPDGMLYVPVGAPCNICEPDDHHAAIFRMKPDGTGLRAVG